MALGLALSNEVKKQDIGGMVMSASANSDAREVVWTWMKMNISALQNLYADTGVLSRILFNSLPFLGIGRVDEVENFFKNNEVLEAEKGILAGIEKLKIYENFAVTLASLERNLKQM